MAIANSVNARVDDSWDVDIGSAIAILYRDSSGKLEAVALGADGTILKVSGGLPVFEAGTSDYTDENAQDAIGGILVDSSTIDFTYNDGTPSISAIVIDGSIGDAKLRNSSALSVIGRSANSTGVPADIAASSNGQFLIRLSNTLGFSDFDTQVRLNRLDQMSAPTASVSMNSQKLTNLATPTSSNDAVNLGYLQGLLQGLDAKASARAATTGNITLSGEQTIDGVAVVTGDRVLVKDQTSQPSNGIYVADSSSWIRATDFDAWAEISGALVFVEEGTANADTAWLCTNNQGGTLGSTNITFSAFGTTTITAGTGITKTGNTISITTNGVTFSLMQQIATDTLLGRSTSGTGNVETIACTAAGRALIDDADAVAQRATLGLTNAATFAWIEVSGTTQTMAPNNGYRANNASLVTLTLPTSAAVDTVIKVRGHGAGGWRIAQNTGQQIIGLGSSTTVGTSGKVEYKASTDDSLGNQYACLELHCITANTTWIIANVMGNPDLL